MKTIFITKKAIIDGEILKERDIIEITVSSKKQFYKQTNFLLKNRLISPDWELWGSSIKDEFFNN